MPIQLIERNDEDGVLRVEVQWYTPLPPVDLPVLTQEQRHAFIGGSTVRVYPEPKS